MRANRERSRIMKSERNYLLTISRADTSIMTSNADFTVDLGMCGPAYASSDRFHRNLKISAGNEREDARERKRENERERELSETIQLTDLSTWMTPSANESARWLLSKQEDDSVCPLLSLFPALTLFCLHRNPGICRIIPGIIAVG